MCTVSPFKKNRNVYVLDIPDMFVKTLLIPVLQNSHTTRTGSRLRSVRLYLGLATRRVVELVTIWTSLNLIALVAQGQLVVLGSHVIHCLVSPILHVHLRPIHVPRMYVYYKCLAWIFVNMEDRSFFFGFFYYVLYTFTW